MNPMRWRVLVGGLLVLAGILALVGSIVQINMVGYFWAALFIFAGLAFVFVLATDKKNWWAAFPGFTLLGIGVLIGVSELFPRLADTIGGALVLGGIGVSFLVVYLLNRSFWWAIIPMGVMFSLVLLIVLEPFMDESVVLFFLGLAATFGVLALLPIENGKRVTWPLYPAAVMLILAFIIGMGASDWAGYLMPVIVILLGGFMVYRAIRSKA